MVMRSYPQEIKELMEKWKPYGLQISLGDTSGIPQEAIEAYKKCKEWAFEQGQ